MILTHPFFRRTLANINAKFHKDRMPNFHWILDGLAEVVPLYGDSCGQPLAALPAIHIRFQGDRRTSHQTAHHLDVPVVVDGLHVLGHIEVQATDVDDLPEWGIAMIILIVTDEIQGSLIGNDFIRSALLKERFLV